MKFFLLIVAMLPGILVIGQAKNNQFILNGEVSGQKGGWIILSYTNNEGKRVKDSSRLENGKFIIRGNINYPTQGFLSGNFASATNESLHTTDLWLEPGTVKITLDANNFYYRVVSGSKTELEREELNAKAAAITDTGEASRKKVFQLMQEFIASHPQSYHSIWLLALNKNSWSFKTIQSLFYQLDTSLYITEHGRFISRLVKEIEDNSPGKPAKAFASVDWKNNPLALESFKGKFVLLDFWASWCLPCRETTPGLISLYNQFHKKGLDIIGISVDNDLNQWKQAIEKDMTGMWYHLVSNKNSTEPRIDKMYGVSTYPTKILVDRKGMIIGRFTGTEEDKDLEEKLRKELGN